MKKVIVGMSGGVDSTVAAVMLSQAGYKVIGVMLDLFSSLDLNIACKNNQIDMELFNDLKERFNIDFHIVDANELFKKEIVDYFTNEYVAGRTPSPCIKCNIFIKFGFMAELMEKYGADYIATGHYANIVEKDGTYYIQKSKNLKKDQSYFLFGINKDLLPKIIFPLGDSDKAWTREFAKKNHLTVHSKPDSQDICLVEGSDYRLVLKHIIDKDKENKFNNIKKSGFFRTKDGQVIGKHLGYYNYTRSQRRKLGVSYHKRMFVEHTDPKTGDVILTDNKEDLLVRKFIAENLNIFNKEFLDAKTDLYIKDHGASRGLLGTAKLIGDKLEIQLKEPSYFVTSGQAAVLYKDDILIAGGWIV